MKKSQILKASGIFLLLLITFVIVMVYYKFKPQKAITLILPEINKVNFVKAVVENDTAYIEIHTVIQNKNFYQLKIDSLHYEIKLKDLAFPHEKVNLQLRQKKFQVDTIKLPVKLPIKSIRKAINAWQSEDSIELTGSFHIFYNTFLGSHELSFNKKLKFSTPIPPEIKVIKVEHRKVKVFDGTVTANVVVRLKNKGKNLDLKIHSIKYKFKIDNLIESVGIYDQIIVVKPRSETTVSIPVTIKIGKLLQASWLVLRDKDNVNYTVIIEAELEEGKLNRKIPVEATASGKAEIVK